MPQQISTMEDELLMIRLLRLAREWPRVISLFGLSYTFLDSHYRKGLSALGLKEVGYTFLSLYHGGATRALLIRRRFDDIKVAGRWESDKSCRWYLNMWRALLLNAEISAAAEAGIMRLAEW